MLLPGPEAQQLTVYIGWLLHRTLGLVAGTLFVLPGLVIMALSWLYAGLGDVPVVEALFFGLKAAVLAIVLEAVAHRPARAQEPGHGGTRGRGLRRDLLRRAVPAHHPRGGLLNGLVGGRAALPACGRRPPENRRHHDHRCRIRARRDHAGACPSRPRLVAQGRAVCLLLWLGPVLACC